MSQTAETSITEMLALWGRGQSIRNAPNGYPPRAAFANLIGRGELGEPPVLPLDLHLAVDAAVCELSHRKPEHYNVIVLAYVWNLRDHQIAERYDQSRTQVRAARREAEAWLEAKLL